jgi:two-component system sensor histidine kinase YesM
MLEQLVFQMDSYIEGMEQISLAVAEDGDIQAILAEELVVDKAVYSARIQDRLSNYIRAREDISDILVLGYNNVIIPSDPEAKINPWTSILEKDWYSGAEEAFDTTVVSSSYVQNLIQGRYSWVVSLSRAILSVEDRKIMGILLVDLKFNRIKELCQSLVIGRKGYNFILDEKGNYVFHPTQQLVYSNIKEEPVAGILRMIEDPEISSYQDGDRYYMVETSGLTGWHVVSVTHDSDIVTDWKYVQIIYALIGLILFLIVGLATNRISSGITKPVRKLQEIMQSVDTGEFRLVGSIKATDEIRELAREYDIMVTRIRELMEANMQEQELKRKSDLKALQAQINPHFLYNTLDSIIWMGEMGQSEKVVQMTSALSKLFRISISKGRELIPIRDEMEHVRSYLTIQEMRYKDKFTYEMDIDPDLYDMITLKITLQPLVENAIYHGIKEVDYEGRIIITGHLEDDLVILEVQDNGSGMNEEQLNEMIQGLETPLEKRPLLSRQGMGVRNVHERIRLYFGPEFGLVCTSTPGEGTTIQVRMPVSSLEALI